MVNLSDESSDEAISMQNNIKDKSDDAELIWQSVPSAKRKRIESPNKQQQRVNLFDKPTTSSNNRYTALDTEDGEVEENQQTTPKPPAIYIPNVENINLMVKH